MSKLILLTILLFSINYSYSQDADPCVGVTPDFTFEKFLAAGGIQFSNSTTFPDGAELTYHWSFGNDKTSEEENPFTTYTSEGKYTIVLLVSDDTGCSSKVEKEVEWSYK
ncbi:MAG: PKD domain-containing protein [Crocinitomicaceae bacterium]